MDFMWRFNEVMQIRTIKINVNSLTTMAMKTRIAAEVVLIKK